jgi:hypothetical protein
LSAPQVIRTVLVEMLKTCCKTEDDPIEEAHILRTRIAQLTKEFRSLRYDIGAGVTDASAVRVDMNKKDEGEESAARPGFGFDWLRSGR